jgi:hypothetical protein
MTVEMFGRTCRTSALPRLHRRTPILKEAKAEYEKLKWTTGVEGLFD